MLMMLTAAVFRTHQPGSAEHHQDKPAFARA